MGKLRTREGILRDAIEGAWGDLPPKELDPRNFGGWLDTRAKEVAPENRSAALQLVKDALASADALNRQGCEAAISQLKQLGPQMPKVHHYVPQFYLREWAGDDGLLGEMGFYRGSLRQRRCSTVETGCIEHLFSIREEGLLAKQQSPAQFEPTLFGPIDDNAARVHQKLLSTASAVLEADEREQWATFIHSILERDPRMIVAKEEAARGVALRVMTDALTSAVDDASRARWMSGFNLLVPEVEARNVVLLGIRESLKSSKAIGHFTSMTWQQFEADGLLTSDRPLSCFWDSGTLIMATIPLSPTRLMVHHNPERVSFVPDMLVANHNLVMMTTKPAAIYSTTVLTAEQEALAAEYLQPVPSC